MALVALKNASIFQGKHLVLSAVNFEIAAGEFVYLIGQTGSGKSSVLKTLYGDIPLTQGEGHVADPCASRGSIIQVMRFAMPGFPSEA